MAVLTTQGSLDGQNEGKRLLDGHAGGTSGTHQYHSAVSVHSLAMIYDLLTPYYDHRRRLGDQAQAQDSLGAGSERRMYALLAPCDDDSCATDMRVVSWRRHRAHMGRRMLFLCAQAVSPGYPVAVPSTAFFVSPPSGSAISPSLGGASRKLA